jgi:hypothetical protein
VAKRIAPREHRYPKTRERRDVEYDWRLLRFFSAVAAKVSRPENDDPSISEGSRSAELGVCQPRLADHDIADLKYAVCANAFRRRLSSRDDSAETAIIKAGLRLGLRLRSVVTGTVAAFGHELVELGPVFGKAQSLQEVLKLALLFLEPAQRIGPIFVESAIAA